MLRFGGFEIWEIDARVINVVLHILSYYGRIYKYVFSKEWRTDIMGLFY